MITQLIITVQLDVTRRVSSTGEGYIPVMTRIHQRMVETYVRHALESFGNNLESIHPLHGTLAVKSVGVQRVEK